MICIPFLRKESQISPWGLGVFNAIAGSGFTVKRMHSPAFKTFLRPCSLPSTIHKLNYSPHTFQHSELSFVAWGRDSKVWTKTVRSTEHILWASPAINRFIYSLIWKNSNIWRLIAFCHVLFLSRAFLVGPPSRLYPNLLTTNNERWFMPVL